MKVVLFSMPDTAPYIAKREWEAPSLGIASVAGNIDKRHQAWLADLVVRKWSVPSSVRSTMRKYRPEIVGLSAMIFQYFTARKIARLIKNEFPGTLIALGGYHATTMRREIADSPEAEVLDFIFEGEGDHAFDELLDALEGRRSMETIGGLSHKQDGVFRHNPTRPLEDVREIDFPERDRRVFRHYHFYFDKADVMETSRGCLLRCNFCSMNQMYGTTFRTYSIDRVLADIEGMYRRGARHVFILDDNITLDVPRLMDLCDGIIGLKRQKMQFVIQASCAGIAKDPLLPRKLADAGITQVFLGIENVDQDNLMQMKKGKIVGVTQVAVKRLIDAGIIVAGGMIVGMVDDDVAAIRRNYEYFVGMGIHNILDQIITPYPGTEMRTNLIADGVVTNLYDYKWYSGYWPQVRTHHLSSKQILFEKWKARRDFLGVWYADGEFRKNYPRWSWLWNNVLRRIILANERRMLWMYGEKGRFRRQMMQWARLNDFFSDMALDPSFFDPDVEGPESIGDPLADLDYGAAPRKDGSTEGVFVSTREMRWSQKGAERERASSPPRLGANLQPVEGSPAAADRSQGA
ncbi:MAG: B12-binding domain-containing radical SAM protein [Vicinamibacteria bacterium]